MWALPSVIKHRVTLRLIFLYCSWILLSLMCWDIILHQQNGSHNCLPSLYLVWFAEKQFSFKHKVLCTESTFQRWKSTGLLKMKWAHLFLEDISFASVPLIPIFHKI
jgi:hypothetical protein